jgi:hypothetical protein
VKLRNELRNAISATSSVFNAVRLTTQFEKDMGKLLQHLPGEPQMHLKIVLGDEELDPHRLSSREAALYHSIADTPRRPSWLTGRQVLKQLMHRCGLVEDSALLDFPHRNFSLSHSGNLAIGVNAKLIYAGSRGIQHELVGTGIDFEAPRTINPRTMKFFLQPDEIDFVERRLAPHSDDCELLRLWTAKEALFKADPNNAGTFPGQYKIQTPSAHSGWASHSQTTAISFLYASILADFGIVTLALALRRCGG